MPASPDQRPSHRGVAPHGIGCRAAPLGRVGKIKIGFLIWCFHRPGPSTDPEAYINIIGEMGDDYGCDETDSLSWSWIR